MVIIAFRLLAGLVKSSNMYNRLQKNFCVVYLYFVQVEQYLLMNLLFPAARSNPCEYRFFCELVSLEQSFKTYISAIKVGQLSPVTT